MDKEREKRKSDDDTSVEEKAKEIEEKAKDIDQALEVCLVKRWKDLFGVRRREPKVIDLPQEEEIPGQEDEEIKVKDTEELEGAKELKEQLEKAKMFETD